MLALGLSSITSAALRAGEAVPWTPLTLSSLTQWGDIDDLEGSANGSPISAWTAKAGGIVMSNTGSQRPVWSDAECCVTFDGVDDLLGNHETEGQSRSSFFSANAGELWMVVNPRAAVGNNGFGFFGNSYSGGLNWYADDSTIYFDCDTYETGRATVARPSGWAHQWHLVRMIVEGTSRRIEVDGIELLDTTVSYFGIPSSGGGTSLGLDAGAAAGAFSLRDWATFKAPLSTEEATALRNYWTTKFSGIFSPLSLNSLTEWFSITSLAGTNDGDPVESWAGEKGLITLASTGTQRPLFSAVEGDGLPAVQFDGIDDILSSTQAISDDTLLGAGGVAYEVWIVVRLEESFYSGLFSLGGISNQIGGRVDHTIQWCAPQGSHLISSGTEMRDNDWHILRFGINAGTRIIVLDGAVVYSATTTAGTFLSGNDLLDLGYFGPYLSGAFRHFLTFKEALSTEDAAALHTYLAAWTPAP